MVIIIGAENGSLSSQDKTVTISVSDLVKGKKWT
jgi:hypothetical protein